MWIDGSLKAMLQEAAQDVSFWVERAKFDFAVSLEAQRRASGVNYKQIAEKLKTSAAYVSKVFRGDSNLTIESMVKLADAAGGQLEVRVVHKQVAHRTWDAQSFSSIRDQRAAVIPIRASSTFVEQNRPANHDYIRQFEQAA